MLLSLLLAVAAVVHAQGTCDNYGIANGSSCACPPGFGGSSCAQAACQGNIFQGSQRQLVPSTGTPSVSNLTGCSCASDWTGTGCNVCQDAGVCQNAYSASEYAQSSVSGNIDGSGDGQNSTLTCNTSPKVWAAGEMSCQVINPTVQSLYPGDTTLNILRNFQTSLTPIPNVTAFGNDNTVYAQLFYNGVEQFYCRADSCTQDTSSGGSNWNCGNLTCTCIPGTTFCGGVPLTNLTGTINSLSGSLGISCGALDSGNNTSSCSFQQSVINALFGSSGLTLSGCSFGECVAQSVIDSASGNSSSSSTETKGKELSGGVIAGLAVVGGLILFALVFLLFGWLLQKRARKSGAGTDGLGKSEGVPVAWNDVSYTVLCSDTGWRGIFGRKRSSRENGYNDDKIVLDSVRGRVEPGQMMAILGPSGAGKTTLVEILAGKNKVGHISGSVSFPMSTARPQMGFVSQQDVLPPTLTVFEALLFAARLRLAESLPDSQKRERVEEVMEKLGIARLKDVRIGDGERRGISGGEMRRVSIGLELVAKPDVLILDEPTSGLDSVSASKVTAVLHAVAHDAEDPTAVIASIHQPSSQLYQTFDQVLLLSHGRALYSGPGGFAPVDYFASTSSVPDYKRGYNVADYLLEIASDPSVGLFKASASSIETSEREKDVADLEANEKNYERVGVGRRSGGTACVATFLTQLEVLSGREWKILKRSFRDKSLFITHVTVASVLGVFCGGLYYQTGTSIAGFQSRVGCLFFLGALIAFSSLSTLYNVVQSRPLFLRERSSSYYSPTAWLLSRFIFDVVPLRLVPTIIVSSVTYWMAGLAPHPANFFKFLFILVLYSLVMTLWNFFLGTSFRNGGIAILLSALTALYQMTYAGFFVHLNSIPPVLRWLQWLCPLKYSLEALSVNEVGSGLMIQDTLQGVPINVSASLIMQLLFGFGVNNYYRDVLVLFAFVAGFALAVIAVVWFTVRERR
ncbi:hypothetical protein NEOLEDRAFT_1095007 [Neolentinus lepideus HHB14362 ss-1]|uniref:ABC transporter domain-containing protein n=1 Tax=Neolentinus lepideus HHB14362 ss-1 TaxID=1314782 RepID=A0A165RMK6_9AGAM|nr:hypothetical protein NEOLEDRAFT_1095007 [Neolentinus lepideus HHB14362 ss-1]